MTLPNAVDFPFKKELDSHTLTLLQILFYWHGSKNKKKVLNHFFLFFVPCKGNDEGNTYVY